MKQFSIIIPVYNAEKYLKMSLDSIINQSFTNFELILVNDGSTDGSKEICEEYAKKDDRIKVITTKNQGSGPARNAGIAIASGKYCYFPDSDDLLTDNALKLIYDETQKCEAELYVFGYFISMRNDKKEIKKERIDDFIPANKIRLEYEKYMVEGTKYIQGAPWNKLFLRENIQKYNIEYPSLKRNQDEVFIVRYMNITKNVKFCNIPIYKYYLNDTQAEWNKFPKNYLEIRTEVYKEFENIIIPWNKENKKVQYNINFNYISTVLKCFEYMYSPKWNMTKEEKKKYIKDCVERKEICNALNFNLKYQKEIMLYMKNELNISSLKLKLAFWQMKLMKNRKINKLYQLSKLMIKIRKLYMYIKY